MRDFANLQWDQWLRARAAEVCLAIAMAPAFAWMSPFVSDEPPFLARLGYWGGLLASWFVMMAIVERLLSALDVVRRMSPAMRRVSVIAVSAFPMIVVAGAATHALKGWIATPLELVEMYFQIILIGSGVAFIAVTLFSQRQDLFSAACLAEMPRAARDLLQTPLHDETGQIRDEWTAPVATGRLVSRLSPQLRGQILCLQMEDHYVRVHTDRGSGLVLLRFSDAIAEMAPTPGRQVHRSWWVADKAVQRFERVGRTGQLHLSLGITVPVSQRYVKLVQGAYAFDRTALTGGGAVPRPVA